MGGRSAVMPHNSGGLRNPAVLESQDSRDVLADALHVNRHPEDAARVAREALATVLRQEIVRAMDRYRQTP
jgi:hypothetical protein